jgi:hypothetical protein
MVQVAFPNMEGVSVLKKYGMVNDKCWVSCFRVKGAFPNIEGVAVQNDK